MIFKKPPIDVVDLLPVLDDMLIDLLQSLVAEEWEKRTIARLWNVKDVAAHLLGGNIQILSMLRDSYYGEKPDGNSFEELVAFLNKLNADWVKAMKRVSPDMLILLHKTTGKLYSDYYKSLDPFEKSPFAVNWAGENESKNWMHIAREYTEKWLHQQQIRDAIGDTGLLRADLFNPFMNIFMQALPYTYRNIVTHNGNGIKINIEGTVSGSWWVTYINGRWELNERCDNVVSEIFIPADISWKLFSRSLRYDDVADFIYVEGDFELSKPALNMVSVMA
jgi:hypothetical protein